jgi:hypothetical protein
MSDQPNDLDLEAQFDHACRNAIAAAVRLGYTPTIWQRMVDQRGAAATARQLIRAGDIQTGLERLVALGRVDLTIEHAVLQPRWAPLFTDADRDAARWRLKQVGVTPDV